MRPEDVLREQRLLAILEERRPLPVRTERRFPWAAVGFIAVAGLVVACMHNV